MTDMVFEAILRPSRLVIAVDEQDIPLQPGMTVTVEVKTGTRSVISYLTAALQQQVQEAGHEK